MRAEDGKEIWIGGCCAGVLLFLIAVVAAFEAWGAAPKQLCTWDISYYLLGERDRKASAHAWMLSVDEQAQLFGPFIAGHVYVDPGKASFTCGGKKVEILTTPLPQGSLLLLK